GDRVGLPQWCRRRAAPGTSSRSSSPSWRCWPPPSRRVDALRHVPLPLPVDELLERGLRFRVRHLLRRVLKAERGEARKLPLNSPLESELRSSYRRDHHPPAVVRLDDVKLHLEPHRRSPDGPSLRPTVRSVDVPPQC